MDRELLMKAAKAGFAAARGLYSDAPCVDPRMGDMELRDTVALALSGPDPQLDDMIERALCHAGLIDA